MVHARSLHATQAMRLWEEVRHLRMMRQVPHTTPYLRTELTTRTTIHQKTTAASSDQANVT